MTLKTNFLPILGYDSTLESKLLNKVLYSKFYIRSYLLDNKKVLTLDNNLNFFNIKTEEYKSICSSSNPFLGKSFTAKEFTYFNNKNKGLAFISFITNNKMDSRFKFFNALKNLKCDSIRSFILLNPVKGGFICYSSGFIAFMPYKHYLIISLFLKSNVLVCKIESYQKSFFQLLLNKEQKNYFSFRLPYFLGSLKVYSPFIRNNFSKKKKHRRKLQRNLNFVFTLQTNKTNN